MSIVSSILGRPVAPVAQFPAQYPPAPAPYPSGQPFMAGIANQPVWGRQRNDEYKSFGSSILHNTAIGAGMGAAASLVMGPLTLPIGAAIGGTIGAGSAIIRHPAAANALGDGIKGALAGATGGAIAGTLVPLIPFGPVGGAAVGAAGGFLTGITNGILQKVGAGNHAVEAKTTLGGRIWQGMKLGAVPGAAVGAAAGSMFFGVGAIPGALGGAALGAAGGGLYGLMSGIADGLTGAKGATINAPKYPVTLAGGYPGQYPGQTPGQYPGQMPGQGPVQGTPVQYRMPVKGGGGSGCH